MISRKRHDLYDAFASRLFGGIKRNLRRFCLAFGLTGLALFAQVASAEVSFAGKTVEWIVPFSAGGGSDTLARFNAPFFSKHLPGQPNVVVVNEPGGGSTKGSNLFEARAKPDGLTILITSGSTQFPYLLGDPRVRYEYANWKIVMASPTGGVVYTSPSTGVENAGDIANLKGKRLIYASQGATSLDLVPMLGFRLMGLDVQHVFGFKGRGGGRLAFERGETNIDYQTSSAYLKNVAPLVESGKAIPLFSWGSLDENGNLVRDPTFPDLPHFAEAYEMLTGEKPSGPDYDAWFGFFAAGFPAQKMVFLPKGTGDDIVEAWRQAIRDMLVDPEYLSARQAVLGKYEQVTDAAADALQRKGTQVSADLRKRVVDLIEREYGVKIKEK